MKKIIYILILSCLFTTACAFWLQTKLQNISDSFVFSKAQYIGNKIINDVVLNIMTEEGEQEIFVLEKDANGKIVSENTNTFVLNNLKSKLHNSLNEKFSNIAENNFSIPIGNIIGYDWFSNFGPSISVKLVFNGSVDVQFENKFYAEGINQTKHICYIVTNADVFAFIGGRQIVCHIANSIPIAETIILGDVPQAYLNNGFLK